MAKADLTAARLRELLIYDAETGVFTNRITRNNGAKIGETASGKRKDGYRYVGLDGVTYLQHRLAWLYTFGEFPCSWIDHINRDPSDNRIKNLREVTEMVNTQNQIRPYRTNKLGVRGVVSDKSGVFRAQIQANKVLRHLGSFKTIEEAEMAYLLARDVFHTGSVLIK